MICSVCLDMHDIEYSFKLASVYSRGDRDPAAFKSFQIYIQPRENNILKLCEKW